MIRMEPLRVSPWATTVLAIVTQAMRHKSEANVDVTVGCSVVSDSL